MIRKLFARLSVMLSVFTLSLTMLTGCSSEDMLYIVQTLISESETEEYYEDVTDLDDTVKESEAVYSENYTAESDSIDEIAEVYEETAKDAVTTEINLYIKENGQYTSKEEVALYIHTYDSLPSNFITKKEAYELGWDSREGNLWKVTDRMSIGGDKFGNYEGDLPTADGRQYYECDINYKGGYRGDERIVFSNDGLIFYTGDHYETFEQLY